MTKIALLVGVSDYEPGLEALPAAVRDVTAMQQVLTHPEMGGFDAADVQVLQNPGRQQMEDAIYTLFANRQREDLVLLYFSGHGVLDDGGEFYLTSRVTRKDGGRLVPTTAVAARSVQSWMSQSRSQRKVIILDSCFSGAFAKGVQAKDSGSLNPERFLGGKGTAILTASTSTQYALTQAGLELSIYTHYLVEGIRTGGADQDDDGSISVEELHDYASGKVKEAAPAMTPEFYPVRDGYKILLAKSPKDDPALKYRKAVEERLHQGKVSIPARRLLDSLQLQLGIAPDIAEAIEAEVLQPYRDYQRRLEEYEQTLVEALQVENPLSSRTLKDLKDYQQHLALLDDDVTPIEAKLLGQTLKLEVKQPKAPPPELTTFEEDLGNQIKLEMIKIPGGRFLMGQTEAEKQQLLQQVSEKDYQKYFARELPQHEVKVAAFFMGKFPVTQAQYEAVMGNNPANFKGVNRPVEQVSWNDAVEFCRKLSGRTGNTYRLPSEAEWEYACRAGTTTPFYFGETITTDLVNYDGNYVYGNGVKGIYREQTTDVGIFQPNAFGLYDMHGNVWEWCADTRHENYENAPTDGSAWIDKTPSDQVLYVLRGGSWGVGPWDCRSAARLYDVAGFRYLSFGFRVSCSASRTL